MCFWQGLGGEWGVWYWTLEKRWSLLCKVEKLCYVRWKVERKNYKLGNVFAISNESMEGSALLALSTYCKTGEERKKLRKELLSKKKPVWKMLSLSTEYILETGPMVWLDRHLLKGLGMWVMDQINHFSRSQEWRSDYPGKACGGYSCVMAWIPLRCKVDQPSLWGLYVIRNNASLNWKRQSQDELKEEWLTGQLTRKRTETTVLCNICYSSKKKLLYGTYRKMLPYVLFKIY